MKKLAIIIVTFFWVQQMYSQETCELEDKVFIDVNAISKCEVETGKKHTNTVVVSRRRYLKKRVYLNEAISLSGNLKTNNISAFKTDSKLDTQLLSVLKSAANKSVSFDSVEKIPSFISCSNNVLDETACFNIEMQKHITSNFRYPEKAIQRGVQGDLKVSFIINEKGTVTNVKVTGASDSVLLKNEAKRIVLLLPKFLPGEEKGVKVKVLYSFPMSFTLE
ncbi:energy transducer TonB [Tenacibaculum soleae]|uniref:energy transducer TonB n=1 Tax=Tenacibaculum soleae TaxID=447689 RepID=UPI002301F8E6|nr:energy transducer TonB [Tenacibaculum soleae]